MTMRQNTTSTTPNVKPQEHIVTLTVPAELLCNCQRFTVNAILYGDGNCQHIQAVRAAVATRK